MLRIITVKFEEKLESFDEKLLSTFLSDKKIIKWESRFFERKSEAYWTILLEYEPMDVPPGPSLAGTGSKKQEKYKDLLGDGDWPLFKRLREWREETAKNEGVPPYIIFTNLQLARIAVTRPTSLNALQQIDGIGDVKRQKYGKNVLATVEPFRTKDAPAEEQKEYGG